jgi:hypothetical protein
MTILQICQDAALELSLVQPTSVVSTTDDTAKKLARHLQKTCLALAKRYDWQILRSEFTFTTTAADEQAGAIPGDFLRFVQNTMYNRTQRRHVRGPLSPAEWQKYKADTTTPVFDNFYKRGNAIYITPTPEAGETIAFEYIKTAIGTNSGGTDLTRFVNDSDEPFWDAELLTLGVVYRYRQAERLDYAEELREFELAYADQVKQDGGRRMLDMDSYRLDSMTPYELDYRVIT